MRGVIAICVCLAGVSPLTASADDGGSLFDDPVQLTAGDNPMGEGILYPSPKMQDLDGDRVPEMLIGDLPGRFLVAKRQGEGDSTRWSTLEPLQTADGQPIKFDNW